MKEMFSISSGVDVAKPITISTNDSKSTEKSSSEDFLSIMFAQIKESLGSSEGEQIKIQPIVSEEETIEIDFSDDTTEKSVDEHLLDDLLKVVSLLKNSEDEEVTFPSFSNKIEKIINNEVALKELKDVNSITDLVKLSEKYDLGLEKISVKNLDLKSIQKEFPKLDKSFFESPKENIQKTDNTLVDTKKETEVRPTVLSINNIEKPIKETKKEPTILEKIMSTPKQSDTKEAVPLQVTKENIKETETDVKKDVSTLIKDDVKKDVSTLVKDDVKKDVSTLVKDDVKKVKTEDTTAKIVQEVKKTINVVQEEAPKIVVKEDQKEINTKVTKENLHVKIEDEVKISESTRVSEPKIETNVSKKSLFENILQGIKTQKQTETISETTSLNTNKTKEEIKSTETTETKTETTVRNELKTQIKTDTIASKQLSPTKNTFNNFAADFKEKLENYKPPFMKVQMALNPKGLGEVDVTIVNRGSNLHVNITSNTNTMSIFTQNQAEFKNSLVNMGFTNLEMNFSDQRQQNQQQNKNANSSNNLLDENYDEQTEERTTSVELVLPQYI